VPPAERFLTPPLCRSANYDNDNSSFYPGGTREPAEANAGAGISSYEEDGFELLTNGEPSNPHSPPASELQYDPPPPPLKGTEARSELYNIFDPPPPEETTASPEAPSFMDISPPDDFDNPIEVAIIDESGEDGEPEPSTWHLSMGKRHARSSWQRRRGKFKYTKKQLGQLRLSTLQTRVKAHEMRNALRRERSETTDADVRFMTALQSFMSQTQSKLPDRLLQLYEDCQTTRETYLPLEDDYNATENKLDRQEYELGNVERRFYARLDGEAAGSYSEPEGSMVFGDSDGLAQSTPSVGTFSEYPARLIEYFSRIGDSNIVRERLENLRGHRAALVEEQSTREAFHLSLDLEAQAFLQNFEQSHTLMQNKLAHIEADVDRLKVLCQEEGLLDPEGEIARTGDDPDLRLELVEPNRHPLLALDSDQDLRFSNISPSPTGNRLSKSKFINKWLLGGLRGSLREIRRLKSMPELQDMDIDPETLKSLVIAWWPKDVAATGTSSFARIGTQTMSLVYESEGELGQGVSLDDCRRRSSGKEAMIRANSV
jgi:hypothetical protein